MDDLRGAGTEVAFALVAEEEEEEVALVSRFGAETEAGIDGRPPLRMDGRRKRIGAETVGCEEAFELVVAAVVVVVTGAPPNLSELLLLVLERGLLATLLIRPARALTFFDGEFASTIATTVSCSDEDEEPERPVKSTVVSLSSSSASPSSASDLSSLSESKLKILRKFSPTRGDSRMILARSALASATLFLNGAGVCSVSPVVVKTTPRIADPGIPGDSLNGLGVSSAHPFCCVVFNVIAFRGVSS